MSERTSPQRVEKSIFRQSECRIRKDAAFLTLKGDRCSRSVYSRLTIPYLFIYLACVEVYGGMKIVL